MSIRLSGLNSGLDTDSIVQALVSAYSYKKETYTKAQTKLSWSQDAWKSLNTKVYSLYTNISSLRYSSAYSLKKTTVSDSTKATVTAGNSAVNGSQKLNILQVAQAGYLTGGKLDKGTTTSTTLAELGYTKGDASINVDKGDGTSTTITVSSTSTVGDVVNQLKSAGLNASLDTTNSRLFVSAKESGADNDFNLIGADSNGMAALSALGLSTSLYTTDAAGNKVTTATGAAYTKYGTYATTADGQVITDESVIRKNITDSLDAYKTASKTYQDATTQVSNLTSALTYAKAYSNVQDFYSQYGISTADQTRLANVMSIASGSRDNTLVDANGNVYTKTSGTDTDGNAVYGYTDKDGNKNYVSKEITYTDKDNNITYKKNDKGEYVGTDSTGAEVIHKGDVSGFTENVTYHSITETVAYESTDSDGNKTKYEVKSRDIEGTDDEGNATTTKQYYFETTDGKEYVSDSETGKFTNTSNVDGEDVTDTIEIAKTYSYEPGAAVSDLVTGTEAYNTYKDTIAQQLKAESTDADYTDEKAQAAAASKLSTYASNLSTVKSFESKVTDTEAVTYSRLNIMNQVHDAYSNGLSVEADGATKTVTGADAVSSLIDTYAGEIASLKTEANEQQTIMDKNDAVASMASITDTDELDKAIDNMVAKALSAAQTLQSSTYTASATKMDGQDAIIKLNDVEYTGSSNSIEVNGITINAQAVTGDGDENAITITTATDTQGIYDKIKDFLTEYNSIINEMCKLYNADSASGYDPLTDDEKDAMSDTEIEKWETKIKDALLRHDSTLNSVMTSMTNAMAKSININGKNYSLSSFGISTLGYFNAAENENYAYHIDGDEDDSNTSGNTDKLMAAISSDPDTVMTFFQKLTSNLYTAIGDKMKSTSLSSVYTIYNDKQMDTQYKEYTTLISDWEDRISTKEDYYYSKFSSMETALAKLNSTQSSLSGYFS
jgi:flagellar hook-associated protein 2